MKRLLIPLLCSILATLALFPGSYSVLPAHASKALIPVKFAPEIAIMKQARGLFAKYGSLPPYKGPAFGKNEPLSPDQAKVVLPYILACESGGRNVSRIDSNGEWSRGPAQFQDATWKERQVSSGIAGKPTEAIPAVQMSLWSLEHGYIWQWSCAKLEGIAQ